MQPYTTTSSKVNFHPKNLNVAQQKHIARFCSVYIEDMRNCKLMIIILN